MNSRFCPHCGAEASKAFVFCPGCGTKLPEVHDETTGGTETRTANLEAMSKEPNQQSGTISGQSTESGDGFLICPTCGFQNLSGARSCESCGSILKGAEIGHGASQSKMTRNDTIVTETSPAESRPIRAKEKASKKEKRNDIKPQGDSPKMNFKLTTVQTVSIVAALLLGSIFVYGLVTTKSVTPPGDNSSNGDVQQQSTGSQPSADVINEIDRLRQVVDKNPSDLGSTLKLSNMLQDNSMYDQAAIYYKRYLDKIPDNIDARVDYGVTLYEGGHTEDAIAQLGQAVKMSPKHQKALFNLGIVYLNAGELAKSNDVLKRCIQIDPQSDVGKQAQQILQEHANIKN